MSVLLCETNVHQMTLMLLDRLIAVLETVAGAGRAISPADLQRSTTETKGMTISDLEEGRLAVRLRNTAKTTKTR